MSQGVYVLGGKCPGGKCPGGKCLGGICPWGKCPGGTCPGGGGGGVMSKNRENRLKFEENWLLRYISKDLK